jgi:NitT/TauT family transport system ATP-binding protein
MAAPVGIAIERVSKSFGAVQALVDIDIAVRAGEFLSLIGPSGCGKTTLLKSIAGLNPIDAGRIVIGGRSVSGPGGHEASLVFQDFALLPWATVRQNAEFGLLLRGAPAAERAEAARKALQKVGLAGTFEHSYPSQLSGGMQQRLSIAQSMICEPGILLLDEPFGALDPGITADMHKLILELWSQTAMTVFMITHDIKEGFHLGTRLLVFDKVRHDAQAPDRYGARITYDIPLRRRAGAVAATALARAG